MNVCLMCLCMHACMSICVYHVYAGAHRGQKRAPKPLNYSHSWLWVDTCMLRTNPRSPEKAATALNVEPILGASFN